MEKGFDNWADKDYAMVSDISMHNQIEYSQF